eukprot:TRINITY_DN28401_c0_g1_i1.p1 TRINITY_DN28401_c0_g1~~TRINITY_DN28401_c0_g1_i1.p1  ORF type:complete len:312 (+),score=44.63 TRINITY_DN28401_c0_g1_i1:52-987(+)
MSTPTITLGTATGTATLRTVTETGTLRTGTETVTATLRTPSASVTLPTRTASLSLQSTASLSPLSSTISSPPPTATIPKFITPTVMLPDDSDDDSFLSKWLVVLLLGALVLIICLLVLCVWLRTKKKQKPKNEHRQKPVPPREPDDEVNLFVDDGFGYRDEDGVDVGAYSPPMLDKPPNTILTPPESEKLDTSVRKNSTTKSDVKPSSFYPSAGAHPTVIYGSPRVLSENPSKASTSKAQSVHLTRYLKGLSSEGTPERPLTAWELPQTEAATYHTLPPSPYHSRGPLDPAFSSPYASNTDKSNWLYPSNY